MWTEHSVVLAQQPAILVFMLIFKNIFLVKFNVVKLAMKTNLITLEYDFSKSKSSQSLELFQEWTHVFF